MECELPSRTGVLVRGSIGVLPSEVLHRYRGITDKCKLLVIDINPNDEYINALERVCGTSVNSRLLDRTELLKPTLNSLNLLNWVDTQLHQNASLYGPAFQYQIISMFLTSLMMHDNHVAHLEFAGHRFDTASLDGYIDKNIHRTIDNDELANLLHVSTSHLYVMMRQRTGISPQEYVTRRRMSKARSLIFTRKFSMGLIAEMVGFADGASFNRAYRRYFGEAPSKTR